MAIVIAASSKRQPFFTVVQVLGFDSSVAQGLLGKSDGTVLRFWWDSAPCGGPGCAARFTVESCPLPVVVFEASRFLFQCKR